MTIGFAILLLLRMLRPWVKVRVGQLRADRIGHLAANTEIYLRQRIEGGGCERERHVFVSGRPANRQLLTMIRRRVPVTESRFADGMYRAVHRRAKDLDIWIDLPFTPTLFYGVGDLTPQLAFTEEEEEWGASLLREIGIASDSEFVCLHARDKAYLDKAFPSRSGEWSYHDYRDCDIKNYDLAAEYLVTKSLYVIRMGAVVEEELTYENEYIIDYATSSRSDFGDIYLSARCKFFLASEGGLSSIPWIFNVPVAYSNAAPPGGVAGWRSPDVFIPKKLWSQEKRRLLSFREILTLSADRWLIGTRFEEAGLEVVENTREEIHALVEEMHNRLEGTWISTDEDEDLQLRYRGIFRPGHQCYGFPSRIGAKFLRQNRGLLH